MPTGCLLVLLEILQVDEIYAHSINFNLDPGGIAVCEIHSGDARQQVHTAWRVSQPDDLIGYEKIRRLQPERSEAKLLERFDNVGSVVRGQGDPDVQVLGVAGMPMQCDRLSADDQVENAVIVE
jgi:hypothetical protein